MVNVYLTKIAFIRFTFSILLALLVTGLFGFIDSIIFMKVIKDISEDNTPEWLVEILKDNDITGTRNDQEAEDNKTIASSTTH